MRMNIPTIGAQIKLTADWTFPCFDERRNIDFINAMRPDLPALTQDWRRTSSAISVAITLPAGTVMTIRRIYIRSGASSFDSVTFSIPNLKAQAKGWRDTGKAYQQITYTKMARFWAKLQDVNEIEYEPVAK